MSNKKIGIIKQVEKLVRDRAHLRTVMGTMLSIAAVKPNVIQPALVVELQKALDYTDNDDD